MPKKIFFQSSLPRVGSTVFQNLMNQDPRFYASSTSGLLELAFAARYNYTNSPEFKAQDAEIMKKAFLAFCREGFFGYYSAITEKQYVIDKSRGHFAHYDFIDSFYPNPKIICLVRNLPDIIASMEKMFRKNQYKSSPLVDHSKMQGTTTPKRVDIWFNSPPIGLAIERLNEAIRQGVDKKLQRMDQLEARVQALEERTPAKVKTEPTTPTKAPPVPAMVPDLKPSEVPEK